MRNLSISASCILILFLAGCSRDVVSNLDKAESYMEGQPEQACALLEEIDSDTIPYMKQQKIKLDRTVSDAPEDEVFHKIPLDRKRYAGDMKYYVLMDEATGSIAASFCNIMQYNGAALLAGKHLLHNALKYGETVRSGRMLPDDDMPGLFNESGISIAEFDEYTRAVDGALMPDMHIPYIAGEYLTGHDAMLEKMLGTIYSYPKDYGAIYI